MKIEDYSIEELQKELERREKEARAAKIPVAVLEELRSNYPLNDYGIWEIRGEDSNCDLGGSHISPLLDTVEGTYEQAIKVAIQHPNFVTWGRGGYIEKIKVRKL